MCVFHDPARASEIRDARRMGGINRTRPSAVLASETPDRPLGTMLEVSKLLGISINQVRRGELEPRVANTIGYLASILLGALQQGSLEERMLRLEAILGTQEEESK